MPIKNRYDKSLVIGAPTIKCLKFFTCDISIKKLYDLDHSVFRCDVIVILAWLSAAIAACR